jgi:hypothetical protein
MQVDPNLISFRIAFLSRSSFDNGVVSRGGILVTDGETKPLEFRCTSPIRPSSLQKVLYGKTLDGHMALELIALPLIKGIQEKPGAVLVREAAFLELRPQIQVPMLLLSKNEELGNLGLPAGEQGQPVMLDSGSGKFEPLVVSAHPSFFAEREQVRVMLAEVFKSFNLLEPFERIEAALNQVHKQAGEGRTAS